jgi:ankyrin repeat protein
MNSQDRLYLFNTLKYLNVVNINNYIDNIKQLIENNEDINKEDSDGNIPLLLISKFNKLEITKQLIDAGANVNIIKNNETPLLNACKNNNIPLAEALLGAGANINLFANNETPLLYALRTKKYTLAKFLMSRGADINIIIEDILPYMYTFNTEDRDILKHILKNGLNNVRSKSIVLIEACNNENVILSLISEIIDSGADVNFVHNNKTALLVAAMKNRFELVKLLFAAGADVNVSYEGKTPLLYAILNNSKRMIEYLISKNADVNVHVDGTSALLYACESGYMDLITQLISAGVNMNIIVNSRSPLRYFAKEFNLTIINKLIDGGLNINKSFPSLFMERHFSTKTVEYLLAKGADVNSEVNNETALINACKVNNYTMVDLLLKKHGILIDKRTADNKTALFHAMDMNNALDHRIDNNTLPKSRNTIIHNYMINSDKKAIIKRLLNEGANINATNNEGQTPLMVFFTSIYKNLDLITDLTTIKYIFVEMVFYLRLFQQYYPNLNIEDNKGNTLLRLACKMKSYDIFLTLLQNNVMLTDDIIMGAIDKKFIPEINNHILSMVPG